MLVALLEALEIPPPRRTAQLDTMPDPPSDVVSTWPEIVNLEDLQGSRADTLRADVLDAVEQLFPPGAWFFIEYRPEHALYPIHVKVHQPYFEACTEILATAFSDVAFPPRKLIWLISRFGGSGSAEELVTSGTRASPVIDTPTSQDEAT